MKQVLIPLLEPDGLAYLLERPGCTRISGDVVMDQAPAMMLDRNKHVQQTKGRGHGNESALVTQGEWAAGRAETSSGRTVSPHRSQQLPPRREGAPRRSHSLRSRTSAHISPARAAHAEEVHPGAQSGGFGHGANAELAQTDAGGCAATRGLSQEADTPDPKQTISERVGR